MAVAFWSVFDTLGFFQAICNPPSIRRMSESTMPGITRRPLARISSADLASRRFSILREGPTARILRP